MTAQAQENGMESSPAAAFVREQERFSVRCDFPGCPRQAEVTSRMCEHHTLVRLSSCGSWVDDSHLDGGHG